MAAKSFKRFQREPSSREPSIWDVYAGQYPQLSAWGAPTYQHWYPYPFTDPNAPQGSTPVSPSEKLGDPGAAAGGAPGGGAGAGGVGVGAGGGVAGGGVGGAGGVGSPFSGVMPPAVEGTGGGAGGAEGGVFPNEVGGFDVPSPPGPGRGDIVGIEPSHAGLAAALALSAIPTPAGPLGLAAELGKVVAGQGLSNIVSRNVPRSTKMIMGYDREGNPVTEPAEPAESTVEFPHGYMPTSLLGGPPLSPTDFSLQDNEAPAPLDPAQYTLTPPPMPPPPLDPAQFNLATPAQRSLDVYSAPPSFEPTNFGATPAPTPASVAPTTDPSEAGGIGTVGMDSGGGGGGGGGK